MCCTVQRPTQPNTTCSPLWKEHAMFRRPSSVLSLAVLVGVVAVAWFAESRRGKEAPRDLDHDELEEALLTRTAEREKVGVEVLAGQLSLREAAARFRAIDHAM